MSQANRRKVKARKAARKKAQAQATANWKAARSAARRLWRESKGERKKPSAHKSMVDCHKDKRIVVFGNGPSINDVNLSDPFFTSVDCIRIGTNAIGAMNMWLDYYVITDKRAYKWYHEYAIFAQAQFNCTILLRASVIKYAAKHGIPLPAKYRVIKYSAENRNAPIEKGGPLSHGRTVGIVALHLAYQMGGSPVYMIGIDGYGGTGHSHFHREHNAENNKVTHADERDGVVRASLITLNKAFEADGRALRDLSTVSQWGDIVQRTLLTGPTD